MPFSEPFSGRKLKGWEDTASVILSLGTSETPPAPFLSHSSQRHRKESQPSRSDREPGHVSMTCKDPAGPRALRVLPLLADLLRGPLPVSVPAWVYVNPNSVAGTAALTGVSAGRDRLQP